MAKGLEFERHIESKILILELQQWDSIYYRNLNTINYLSFFFY